MNGLHSSQSLSEYVVEFLAFPECHMLVKVSTAPHSSHCARLSPC
uniref:Uncharacterized protein n=1 Tax=Anguilla anguilla TaxID=7936 RepID=A0A0E9RJH2_ANGAN